MTYTEKNALREIDCYGGFKMSDNMKGCLLAIAIYSTGALTVYLAGGFS